MNTACEKIHKLLVEYADGDLSSDEALRVERHLAACEACRNDAVRLRQSLQLCRREWDCAATLQHPVIAWPASLVRAVALVACCVLTMMLFRAMGVPADSAARHGTVEMAQPSDVARPLATNVEASIQRVAIAARLEASLALLGSDPALQHYREQTNQLLAEQFADLEAGKRAKLRLAQNE